MVCQYYSQRSLTSLICWAIWGLLCTLMKELSANLFVFKRASGLSGNSPSLHPLLADRDLCRLYPVRFYKSTHANLAFICMEFCLLACFSVHAYTSCLTIVKRRKLKWYGHVSCSSGLAKTILQGTVKGGRRQGKTEEEVWRQHQGMDRPGVHQVPEGSGEQGKMEETGCKIICDAQTTLMVKG